MKHISLPSLAEMQKKLEQKGPKHKTESAAVCEDIGKEFGKNVYWMQYKYVPRRLRDALKAYQIANKPVFKKESDKWRYFMAILIKTI